MSTLTAMLQSQAPLCLPSWHLLEHPHAATQLKALILTLNPSWTVAVGDKRLLKLAPLYLVAVHFFLTPGTQNYPSAACKTWDERCHPEWSFLLSHW